jgi:peroxisomal membrane protein 4
VTLYKTLLLLQRKIKGFEHHSDSFIAGIIGGYVVFGKDNPGRLSYISSRESAPD